MRVLLTNDDGIDAPGLRALVGPLVAEGFELVVVAPDEDYSGAGAGLVSRNRLEGAISFERRTLEEAPDVEAWAVGGPPARCSLLSLRNAFGAPPDAVVSGINFGINTGPAVFHSGTFGAALTAARLGVPSLATSAQFDFLNELEPRFDTAAALTMRVFKTMLESGHMLINLNVPRADLDEVKGVRSAVPAPVAGYRSMVESREDGLLKMGFEIADVELPDNSDTALVRSGWAAVTSFDTALGVTSSDELVASERLKLPGSAD